MEIFSQFLENEEKRDQLLLVASAVILLSTPTARSLLTSFLSRLHLHLLVSNRSSLNDDDDITVSGLYVHPVKSLKAVSVKEAELDGKGFINDRRFMLVTPAPLPIYGEFLASDATHRFLTQRTCPSLATVTATIKNDQLTLSYQLPRKALSTIIISTKPLANAPLYRASVWDDLVQVRDMGDEVADFLQYLVDADPSVPEELKKGVRLVVQDINDDRSTKYKYTPASIRSWNGTTPPVGLQDGFPLLIASEASLKELNSRLLKKGKDVIPMSRFRPNIVVSGCSVPFEEDNWKVIRIEGVLFHIVKGCPRCKQSCTDQDTGKVSDEPLATMTEFRALGPIPEDVFFCQNVAAQPGSEGRSIFVGSEVEVLQRGEPIWKVYG